MHAVAEGHARVVRFLLEDCGERAADSIEPRSGDTYTREQSQLQQSQSVGKGRRSAIDEI